MNNIIRSLHIFCALLLLSHVLRAQQYTPLALQEGRASLTVNAGTSSLIPLGGLKNRNTQTMGYSVIIGEGEKETSWWGVGIEYFSFDGVNTENLKIRRKVPVNGVDREFTLPLNDLPLNLEVAGAFASLTIPLVNLEYLRTDLSVNFGLYRWFGVRGAYSDSLYADTSGVGDLMFITFINAPEIRQQDWSGGATVGLDIEVPLFDMMSLHAGARYKLILGELWPSLALDMENVSGFQMAELRAALKFRF